MDEAKLKRWGWGAIIGLIGVILVAGLVIAISMSSPKPKATTASGEISLEESEKTDTKKEESEKKAAEEKAAKEKTAKEKAEAEKRAAEEEQKRAEANKQNGIAANESNKNNGSANTNNMPKTGPTDTVIAALGAGVVAYLAALNFGLIKKRA